MPNWELEQGDDGVFRSWVRLTTPKGHKLFGQYFKDDVYDEKGEWVRDEYSDEHTEAYAELERMVEVMNREETNA